MEKFIFKKEKFELECTFTPYFKGDIYAKDIKVAKVIAVPECYKGFTPEQIQPIVEHYYLDDMEETAVLSLDEDYFKEEDEEEGDDWDWESEYERRWEERTGR